MRFALKSFGVRLKAYFIFGALRAEINQKLNPKLIALRAEIGTKPRSGLLHFIVTIDVRTVKKCL